MKRLLKWVIGIVLIPLSPFIAAAGFFLFLLQAQLLFWAIVVMLFGLVMGITALRILGRIFRPLGITPASTDAFLNRLRPMVRLMRRRHVSPARMRVVVLCYAVKLSVVGPRPAGRLRSHRKPVNVRGRTVA